MGPTLDMSPSSRVLVLPPARPFHSKTLLLDNNGQFREIAERRFGVEVIMRFTVRSSHVFCYLLATIMIWLSCCAPGEAHRFKKMLADTNMFHATKRQAKSQGKQAENIAGGPSLSAYKDVEKANTQFPPYIVMSKPGGERVPRTHIMIVATPINQNMHYKDGQSKPDQKVGGKKNAPWFQHNPPDAGLYGHKKLSDMYRMWSPKKGKWIADSKIAENLKKALSPDDATTGDKTPQSDMPTKAKVKQHENNMKQNPQPSNQKGQNQQQGQMQGASEACADAFDPCWQAMLELHMDYLINVANENAGQPCGGREAVKVHENAVWMVMQMYKRVYINIGLLLLLPGAVLTQVKGIVSSGILQSRNDEDAVSPFVGILRGMIALFLIPCTQLIVSYTVDIGNSMNYEVKRHISVGVITDWADEQVFRAPEENKEEQIKAPTKKTQGKMTEGSEKDSGVEAQSLATIMLQLMANLAGMSAAFGLVMMCAFQITMMSYLMLLGPIAAAFYAWPATVGQLFMRVFAIWLDAVVNVGLWRFLWCVVLLAAQTRIEWLSEMGQYNPFCEWELIMFIAFVTILSYVPFNPFDFKPGEMVAQIMQKAEQAVNESAQDAKKKGGK